MNSDQTRIRNGIKQIISLYDDIIQNEPCPLKRNKAFLNFSPETKPGLVIERLIAKEDKKGYMIKYPNHRECVGFVSPRPSDQFWVLQTTSGEELDYDMYRHDLLERWNIDYMPLYTH
jgi:hypothetical protein